LDFVLSLSPYVGCLPGVSFELLCPGFHIHQFLTQQWQALKVWGEKTRSGVKQTEVFNLGQAQ
jgi:hypothetical protein